MNKQKRKVVSRRSHCNRNWVANCQAVKWLLQISFLEELVKM